MREHDWEVIPSAPLRRPGGLWLQRCSCVGTCARLWHVLLGSHTLEIAQARNYGKSLYGGKHIYQPAYGKRASRVATAIAWPPGKLPKADSALLAEAHVRISKKSASHRIQDSLHRARGECLLYSSSVQGSSWATAPTLDRCRSVMLWVTRCGQRACM